MIISLGKNFIDIFVIDMFNEYAIIGAFFLNLWIVKNLA